MRFILMLIAFAVAFSGYASVAHAFGDDLCNPASVQLSDDGADITGHTAHKTAQKDKSCSDQCPECTHCCASHAIGLPGHSVHTPPLLAVFESVAILEPVGRVYFSLLRPPKPLV